MKKAIRAAALILALLMLALPLVGCDKIDEMRANHGFWNDDGSISFNGETYKLLSPSTYLYLIINPTGELDITEKNVPVLLSEEYGTDAHITFDKLFIRALVGDRYNVYCREDKYDYVEQSIKQNGNMDYLGFYYYPYENGGSVYLAKDFHSKEVGHIFAEEETDTIIDIMMSVEGLNYSDWKRNWSKYYNSIKIYRCSDDMLFRRESEFIIFFKPDFHSNRYFISDGDFAYSVPKEYDTLFDNMFKEYLKSFS
ncbi:MAG: hypothetical protein E7633_06135 [Ruminococcaceae bacterium]|nr:hypothetical protein [Oscillospiraceae bacterium]